MTHTNKMGREANARLIAAAPEMYGLLESLANEPERMTDEDEREKTIFEIKEILDNIKGL